MNLSPQTLDALLHQVSPAATVAAGGLGTVMPMIVAFISQPRFTKRQKALLSVASCVVASAVVCLATGAFTGLNWMASLFILLQVSWSFYARLYKPTGASDWFEKATAFSKFGPTIAQMMGSAASSVLAATGRYTNGQSVSAVAATATATDADTAADTTTDAPAPDETPAPDSSVDAPAAPETTDPAPADAVPDAQAPAPDAQAPAPDAQAPAPDAQAPAPDAQAPAPDAQTPAPDAS